MGVKFVIWIDFNHPLDDSIEKDIYEYTLNYILSVSLMSVPIYVRERPKVTLSPCKPVSQGIGFFFLYILSKDENMTEEKEQIVLYMYSRNLHFLFFIHIVFFFFFFFLPISKVK